MKERSRQNKQVLINRKKKSRNIKVQVGQSYREAMSLYKKREFDAAVDKFRQCDKLLSAKVLEEKYVTKMQTKVDQKKQQLAKFRQKYIQKKEAEVAQIKKAQLPAKKIVKEKKVLSSSREQRKSSTSSKFVQRIYKQQEMLRDQRAVIREELKQEVVQIYNQAVYMYKKGQHADARNLFYEIETIHPDYEKVRWYLAKLTGEKTKKSFSSGKERGNIVSEALEGFK